MKPAVESAQAPRRVVAYRSLGGTASYRRIGCGRLEKSPGRLDEPWGQQPTWSLVYVIAGSGTYTDHLGHARAVEAGSCFQRHPDRPHANHIAAGPLWVEWFLDLDPDCYRSLADLGVIRADPAVWHIGVRPSLARRFENLLRFLHDADLADLPRATTTLLALAADLQHDAFTVSADDALIERACRFLGDDLASRMSLREFCRLHHVGYERFRRLFTRRVGVSPHRYRIRRRIDHARELLADSRLTIAAIAERLGYRSPYEFSTQFRHYAGQPPSAFRSQRA